MWFPYVQTETCYKYQSRRNGLDDNVLWKCHQLIHKSEDRDLAQGWGLSPVGSVV